MPERPESPKPRFIASEQGLVTREYQENLERSASETSMPDVREFFLDAAEGNDDATEKQALNRLAGQMIDPTIKNLEAALDTLYTMQDNQRSHLQRRKKQIYSKEEQAVFEEQEKNNLYNLSRLRALTVFIERTLQSKKGARMIHEDDAKTEAKVKEVRKNIGSEDKEESIKAFKKSVAYSIQTLQRGMSDAVNISHLKLGSDVQSWKKLSEGLEVLRREFVKDVRMPDIKAKDYKARLKDLFESIKA